MLGLINKIAIQTRAQIAADKQAVGLSRVHMYESKCILPLRDTCLFCSYKHINTARMHTISRQFIPLIYRPLGERILSKSNLFCPFTSVKSFSLVILHVLILKKYIRLYIFMTIQYLKRLYLITPPPLNRSVSSVVRPHSFNLSS